MGPELQSRPIGSLENDAASHLPSEMSQFNYLRRFSVVRLGPSQCEYTARPESVPFAHTYCQLAVCFGGMVIQLAVLDSR